MKIISDEYYNTDEKETITWTEQETKECGCIKEHFGFKKEGGRGQGVRTIEYCNLHEEKERLLKRINEIDEELKV